jgi:sirohydrochlorin ferrochelatase
MQGVLYVSHGSRVKEAAQQAVSFLEDVKKKVDVPLQEICFLELAEPDIAAGAAKLVEQGALNITVIPVLLLSAGHYYEDIPEEIEEVKRRYPHISFTYGKPIGVQERVIDIAVDRIRETGVPMKENASLLIVGRGSRDPQTKKDIEHIAGRLKEKTGAVHADVCYLAACSPSFDEGLEKALERAAPQTFVVPYLWFTGILMQTMQQKIDHLSDVDRGFILCSYLGDHPNMIDALAARVYEALPAGVGKGESR